MLEFVQGALLALVFDQIVFPLVNRIPQLRWLHRNTKGHLEIAVVHLVLGSAFAAAYQSWFLLGIGVVYALCEFWRWWNRGDTDKRRRRFLAKHRVTFRIFTPSPIPAPGGTS